MSNSSEGGGGGLGGGGLLGLVGLVFQPVVWVSLYSLASTGHGLPAGPAGLIGAVEGVAYLLVVLLALLPRPVAADDDGTGGGKLSNEDVANASNGSSLILGARKISRITIAVGFLVLAGVVAGKGCVPNAKPLLDYSEFLPVCDPN